MRDYALYDLLNGSHCLSLSFPVTVQRSTIEGSSCVSAYIWIDVGWGAWPNLRENLPNMGDAFWQKGTEFS